MMIYLFCFYVMMVPLEYIQEKIPKGPTGVNYIMLMLLAMVIWWIARGTRNGRRFVSPTPLNALLFVFLGYSYFGLFLTAFNVPGAEVPINPTFPAFNFFIRLCNGFLFFWLGANMVGTRKQIRWVLYAIGLSMVLVWRAFRSDISLHSTSAFRNVLRFAGPFVYIGSNELAALFVIGCIFFGLFALAQRKTWEKVAFAVAAGLYAYGVLYSYSRGAQLSVIIVAVLVASIRYRWLLILLAIAVLTQDFWVPVSVRERWEMTETEDGQLEESAASRTRFWETAMKLFASNPVLGTGLQSFRHLNPEKMDSHNIYMRVLAEQGLIGIGLFMAIWFQILKLGFSLWTRAPDRWDRQYGFALMMTAVGLMIANIFGDRFSHLAMIGQFWALVGMGQRLQANMTGVERFEDEVEALPVAADETAAPPSGYPPPPVVVGGLREGAMTLSPSRPEVAMASKRPEGLIIVGGPAPALTKPEPGPLRETPALNIVGRNPAANHQGAPS